MISDSLVSVLMPVYNCGPFVGEALESIRVQTHRNLEIIVIDDGSTDETPAVLAAQAAQDDRVKVFTRPNRGIVATLNEGLELARGEFIARMDGDDISVPERFEKQLAFLADHPDVDMVGSWVQLFGAKNEIWHQRADDNHIRNMLLLRTNGLQHPAIMVRGDTYRRFRYDPEYQDVEDTELYVRMALATPRVGFANIQEVLLNYRVHPAQVSTVRRNRQDELYTRIVTRYLCGLGLSEGEIDQEAHRWLCEMRVPLSPEEIARVQSWRHRLRAGLGGVLGDAHNAIEQRWVRTCEANRFDPKVPNG